MDNQLIDYIKPDDRETYDFIFEVATDLCLKYDKSSYLYQTGALMFVILNQWERGELRQGLPTISQMYTTAMAFREFHEWNSEHLTDDMVEKFQELLAKESSGGADSQD